jgi:hypothetical protein
MSQVLWVFLGGAVSAYLVSRILGRWPTRWTALVVNSAMSFLLGALAATAPAFPPTVALAGYGLLGTATSLMFVVGDRRPVPVGVSATLRMAGGVARLLALHAVLCAAFAMLGFLCGEIGLVLVYKPF